MKDEKKKKKTALFFPLKRNQFAKYIKVKDYLFFQGTFWCCFFFFFAVLFMTPPSVSRVETSNDFWYIYIYVYAG